MPLFRRATGLARVGAVGALLLAGAGVGYAEDDSVILIPSKNAASVVAASPAEAPIIVQTQAQQASPVATLGGAQSPSTPPATQPASPNIPPPWNKVPPAEPTPRYAYWIMPPSGCGYYSAQDCLRDKEL
ncbi:MAG TPA: hypothetical protein VFA18_22750, partial [Gemmataceae bacterium]|nr:hypothetical protein [Gemmataceae bacterium]